MADRPLTRKELEKLLSEQTDTILNAVDERLDVRIRKQEARFEERFSLNMTSCPV